MIKIYKLKMNTISIIQKTRPVLAYRTGVYAKETLHRGFSIIYYRIINTDNEGKTNTRILQGFAQIFKMANHENLQPL